MKRAMRAAVAVAMGAALAAVPAVGATTWTTTFYTWLPQYEGSVGVGPVEAPVDVSFDDSIDVLSELQGAFMLHVEGQSDPYTLIGDVYWMSLEGDEDTPIGDASLALRQTIGELALTYKLPVSERGMRLEALAGGRYMKIDTGIEADAVGVDRSTDEEWADPFVGGRIIYTAGKGVMVVARGDYGGFGVGSEDAWNAVAAAQWAFAKNWTAAAGYRWLDVKYDDDGFVYDVRQDGPMAGVGYRW